MSVFLRFTGLSGLPLVMLSVLLGVSASPAFGQSEVRTEGKIEDGKLIIPPDQRRQMKAALAQQMGTTPRPKTGRNVVEALRAAKQYSTFLSLAERGGMLPLLQGTTSDTTTPAIVLVQDSVKIPGISSADIQVQGTEGGASETDLKSSVMDMMQDVMGEVVMGVVAEEGKITVFAPTDAAFAKLPKASLDSLLGDPVAAAALVRSHIVNRGVYRDGFGKVKSVTSLTGSGLAIASKAPAPTVNDIAITEGDVAADNGVAHGIAAVLPKTAPKSSQTSTSSR